MLKSTWVRVRAPFIPDVAFVEFPPKNPEYGDQLQLKSLFSILILLTLLVEHDYVATSEINGVRCAETGHLTSVLAS